MGEIRFGVRGHDFGRAGAARLASLIREAGFSLVQLAPSKALAGYPGSADPEAERNFARGTALVFKEFGVGIPVLGCYVSPLHPDSSLNHDEIDRFSRGIGLCGIYKAGLAATETGPRTKSGDAYRGILEAFSLWAEAAENAEARIAVEPVHGHVIGDPVIARRLLDDVASPCLGVIYDPANLVDPSDPDGQSKLFQRALDLLGDRIWAMHAKDIVVSAGKKKAVFPGSGLLDWNAALRGVRNLPSGPPVIIEDQKPSDYGRARSFLETVVQDD